MRRLRSFLGLATFAFPVILAAQTTTYIAPNGLFTVQVPTGWQDHYEPNLNQVTFSKGPLLAIVMVSPQNKSNALTAKEFLDANATDFSNQCPTYQAVQDGDVSLAGNSGKYALFTCSDPKSPAVAETSAVLTATPTLIAVTLISPLSLYFDNLPTLDAIRDSLRLTGQPVPHVPDPKDLAFTELRKACRVGVFPQIECARRIAIHNGGGDFTPSRTSSTSAGVYHDGQHRFTVSIPDGWQATAEGDNGSLGVQLRSGSSFINIMPAPPASSTDDVVLQQDHKIADLSHSSRKPPFAPTGIIQLLGNGIEVSYDHFSSTSSADGNPVDSYVAGVGDISGKGPTFLLVIASLQTGASAATGGTFIATAQSIHLTIH